MSSSRRGDWAEGVKESEVLLGYRRGCRFYCGQGVHQDRSSL
ncbi:hypothetical protein [Klebsiella pneumoniae]